LPENLQLGGLTTINYQILRYTSSLSTTGDWSLFILATGCVLQNSISLFRFWRIVPDTEWCPNSSFSFFFSMPSV
jgi:hypothetical protein